MIGRIRFCKTDKIAFVRRENAKREIRQARLVPRQYHGRGGAPQTYYLCPICGFYHVTKSRRRGNRTPI